jgi:hypothetical protein
MCGADENTVSYIFSRFRCFCSGSPGVRQACNFEDNEHLKANGTIANIAHRDTLLHTSVNYSFFCRQCIL